MFNAKQLLDQFVGGGQGGDQGAGDFLRGAGGGALAGGLAALLLGSKTGRKIGGEALKMGGMAAVGALAYKAYHATGRRASRRRRRRRLPRPRCRCCRPPAARLSTPRLKPASRRWRAICCAP